LGHLGRRFWPRQISSAPKKVQLKPANRNVGFE
jgi:hypothetical protein